MKSMGEVFISVEPGKAGLSANTIEVLLQRAAVASTDTLMTKNKLRLVQITPSCKESHEEKTGFNSINRIYLSFAMLTGISSKVRSSNIDHRENLNQHPNKRSVSSKTTAPYPRVILRLPGKTSVSVN